MDKRRNSISEAQPSTSGYSALPAAQGSPATTEATDASAPAVVPALAPAAAPVGPTRPRRDFHFHGPTQRNLTRTRPLLTNHQVLYRNIGPNPGPCHVCQTERQPENIYLRHCIPQCPAVILPFQLFFATSNLIAPNAIYPHVMYHLGANYVSSVPGGFHLVQPVIIGVFDPPPPANVANAPICPPANVPRNGSNTPVPNERANFSGNRGSQQRTRVIHSRRFRNIQPKAGPSSFRNKKN